MKLINCTAHSPKCVAQAFTSRKVPLQLHKVAWSSATCRRKGAFQSAAASVAAAKVEDPVEEDIDDLEDGVDTEAAQAQSSAQTKETLEDSDFTLNFLWMDKNIAVAVDQNFSKDQRSPVTEYFFWPRKDAWEELKIALEARPWISARDKVVMLNRTTEVINFWQTEGDRPSIEQAQQTFPDCVFRGS